MANRRSGKSRILEMIKVAERRHQPFTPPRRNDEIAADLGKSNHLVGRLLKEAWEAGVLQAYISPDGRRHDDAIAAELAERFPQIDRAVVITMSHRLQDPNDQKRFDQLHAVLSQEMSKQLADYVRDGDSVALGVALQAQCRRWL